MGEGQLGLLVVVVVVVVLLVHWGVVALLACFLPLDRRHVGLEGCLGGVRNEEVAVVRR